MHVCVCIYVYIYKKKYSILTLAGQQGSLRIVLMIMKLFFHAKHLGFLLFFIYIDGAIFC